MRISIAVDNSLMKSALRVSGFKTRKDTIEEGLRLLVQLRSQKDIKGFREKLKWSGNLDETRLDR